MVAEWPQPVRFEHSASCSIPCSSSFVEERAGLTPGAGIESRAWVDLVAACYDPWVRKAQAVVIVAGVGILAAACTLLTGVDDLTLTMPVGISPDADTESHAETDAAALFDAGADVTTRDADAGDARASAEPCFGGGKRLPLRVDVGPPTPQIGSSCNINAILEVDGVVAGLDRVGDPQPNVAGRPVVTCARLDFGKEHAAASITTTARSSPNACGASACTPIDGCGTGDSFDVFVAGESLAYVFVDAIPMAPMLQSVTVPVPAGSHVRYVLVCRRSWGLSRDDVEVDGVVLTCP